MSEQRINIYGEQRRPDRNDIRFRFEAVDVRNAATERAAHHRKRLEWWQDELGKAQDALEKSMQLRSQEITGGTRKVAVFDEEKQQRLSECTGKVSEHRKAAEEFEAWAAGLQTLAGESVSLDIQDVRFFHLGATPEEPQLEAAA